MAQAAIVGRRASEPDFTPHSGLGRLSSVDSLAAGGAGMPKRAGSGALRIRTDSRRASELLPGILDITSHSDKRQFKCSPWTVICVAIVIFCSSTPAAWPCQYTSHHLQGMERRVHHLQTLSWCWRLQGAAARC
jgi:hypothetical protein